MCEWIACTNFLEHFVNLKVLAIESNVDWNWGLDSQHSIPPRFLRLLPAPRLLRRLVFKSNSWDRKLAMEEFDWLEDLDAELGRETFHDLTEVACLFGVWLDKNQLLGPFTSKEQITELIEGKMLKLSSRRPTVLRIDVTVHEYGSY